MAKILLVDDNKLIRLVESGILNGLGHEVATAEDGTSAVLAFRQQKPDLVILDYQMPGASGTEVLRELRSLDQGANVPVIFLSGTSSLQIMSNATEDLPLSCFLEKPVNSAKLKEAIDGLLSPQPQTPTDPPAAPVIPPQAQIEPCPACRAENPAGARFCLSCGKPIGASKCPKCQTQLPAVAKFCFSCGEKLAG
ncbi:MAG: response regulator [Elusimicrobia bacterium]|nr:response regulator [Elusimicrobiota bacterium]